MCPATARSPAPAAAWALRCGSDSLAVVPAKQPKAARAGIHPSSCAAVGWVPALPRLKAGGGRDDGGGCRALRLPPAAQADKYRHPNGIGRVAQRESTTLTW